MINYRNKAAGKWSLMRSRMELPRSGCFGLKKVLIPGIWAREIHSILQIFKKLMNINGGAR